MISGFGNAKYGVVFRGGVDLAYVYRLGDLLAA